MQPCTPPYYSTVPSFCHVFVSRENFTKNV